MSYLGQAPGQGEAERFTFTASGGETSVTHATDGVAINYSVGQVELYLNGIKLVSGSDFTATNGSTITGLSALAASDVVDIVALSQFSPADTVPATGGTFSGAITAPSIQLSSNIIKASDGGTAITLDTSDNVTLAGTANNVGTVTAGTLGSNVVFPSGKITNVFLLSDTAENMSTTANSGSPVIACTPFSFSAISGRKYSIHGSQFLITSNETGSAYTHRIMEFEVYYGTTSRSINDTTVDTRIFKRDLGRNQSSSTTAGLAGYMDAQYCGYFTAGSTATHYVYTTICNSNSNSTKNYAYNTATTPHNLIIYEIMP